MNKVLTWMTLMGMLFLMVACGNGKKEEEDKKKEKPVPVEIAKTYRGNIDASYSGSTALEAEGEANVVAKVSGIVEKIFVEEGDLVRTGSVMAQIEQEQYRLRMEQAKASMSKLQKEYERSQSLLNENIVSKETFDRIKYDYENQKAVYDLASYELSQTRIVASIDGMVTQRMIKVGNQIQVSQQLFHIADFSPILGVLHVPEKELDKMKSGLVASVVADAIPGKVIAGFIKLINPVINAQTGTVKITIEINDTEKILKPGMFARVHIVTDTHKNTLLIPRDALISEDTENYVYIMQEVAGKKTVKKQTVDIGYTNTSAVEIIKGLSENDQVVTIGHSTLKDGSQIEVIQNEKAN